MIHNSVYSRTMGHLRNRVGVRLIINVEDYQKLVSRHKVAPKKMFHKNLVAVYKIKDVWTLKKPDYLDIGILDLCKTLKFDLTTTIT